MQSHVTVKEWIAMFEEIGLDEEAMMKWHGVFELRHPEGHQSFLEWLGLPAEQIAAIRSGSK